MKLSSPTAAKTTHTADGKHPARYSSYSRESATPYVRKSALKSGVIRHNCRKRKKWGVICTVQRGRQKAKLQGRQQLAVPILTWEVQTPLGKGSMPLQFPFYAS